MRVCHTVISFLGLFHLNLANSLSCEALESLICLEDVSLIKDCVTQVGKTWKRDAGLVVFLADSPEDHPWTGIFLGRSRSVCLSRPVSNSCSRSRSFSRPVFADPSRTVCKLRD